MPYQSIANLRLDKSYQARNPGLMKDRLANLDPVRRLIVERAAQEGALKPGAIGGPNGMSGVAHPVRVTSSAETTAFFI